MAPKPRRAPASPRRGTLASLAFAIVLATFGSIVALEPRTARAVSAETTSSLNLRAGPGTNNAVLTVMPGGAAVEITGDPQNGFYPVTYNGLSGWASGDYLSIGGSPGGGSGSASTTTRLNLRSGPSLGDSVLLVIPAGASVTLTGDSANGFLSVSYNGTNGWASATYLDTGGNPGGGDPGGSPGGSTGNATVTSSLNLRAGPSLGDAVILVMPAGATVSLTGNNSNGFLSVSYNGTSGWAHGDYLDTDGGGDPGGGDPGGSPGNAVVVSSLRLRSGPSLGASVILIMPAGASITLTGNSSNGFLSVTYNGTSGWAHGDYIDAGGASGPGPNPDPGPVTGSAVTRSSLNLRAGPSTGDAVILVMPGGAVVETHGDPQNGFYPVSYNGTSGWAFGDYLDFGGSSGTTEDEIIAIIYAAADRYGQPRQDMLRVARCESGLDPNAFHPVSHASGLFQFLPSTWASTPYASYDIFDAWASANAAGWMWSVGRRGEWVCQ